MDTPQPQRQTLRATPSMHVMRELRTVYEIDCATRRPSLDEITTRDAALAALAMQDRELVMGILRGDAHKWLQSRSLSELEYRLRVEESTLSHTREKVEEALAHIRDIPSHAHLSDGDFTRLPSLQRLTEWMTLLQEKQQWPLQEFSPIDVVALVEKYQTLLDAHASRERADELAETVVPDRKEIGRERQRRMEQSLGREKYNPSSDLPAHRASAQNMQRIKELATHWQERTEQSDQGDAPNDTKWEVRKIKDKKPWKEHDQRRQWRRNSAKHKN